NPEKEFVPELAHMTLEEQQTMLAAVDWQIDLGAPKVKRPSRRHGIPRYKSYWPGYAVICGACGKLMTIEGDHLRCPRSKKDGGYTCWCRVQIKLEPMRAKTARWLAARLREFPEALQAFVDSAWKIVQERSRKQLTKRQLHEKEILRL